PGGGPALAAARSAVDELVGAGTARETPHAAPAYAGSAAVGSGSAGSDSAGLSADERAGARAVRAALAAPLRQLADNAGADGAYVVAGTEGLPPGHGWNADTGTYDDLPAAGVLDPVRVPRTALENAASVAGLMLTAGALVVDRAPRDPDAVSWRRRGHGHGHDHGQGHGHGHAH
ncbi:TCP-1/cpn60 chaperonin family protein, partial [Streptomyces synnematoformans]|uniref:TCP-1/cpn60 chaperonin family protein n=1 Tax=Streptomyces synnematoformans TaxID=415721 RepID=UPI0031DE80E0